MKRGRKRPHRRWAKRQKPIDEEISALNSVDSMQDQVSALSKLQRDPKSVNRADALQLQRMIGNQGLVAAKVAQEAIQRQSTSGQSQDDGFNPLDQSMLYHALQVENERSEAPIRAWLDEHPSLARQYKLADLVILARQQVPEASNLQTQQLAAAIQAWANYHGHSLPRVSLIPLSLGENAPAGTGIDLSQFTRELAGLLDIPTEIKVVDDNGLIKIALSGATAELHNGSERISTTLAWSGSLGVHAVVDNFGFSANLSGETWQMGFTYATGSTPPSIESLQTIFEQGEKGLRGLLGTAAHFPNLSEIPALQETISTNFEPVKAAIGTVSEIAKAEQDAVSFSAAISGRTPGSDNTATPEFQFTASLTISF